MNSAKRVLSFQRSLSSKITSSGSIVLSRAGTSFDEDYEGSQSGSAVPGDPWRPHTPRAVQRLNESCKAISSAGFQKQNVARSLRINSFCMA